MTISSEIIDFVAREWFDASLNPGWPPVREDIGRGIALPIKVGEHPDRFSAMYLRKAGSSWIVEPGSRAHHVSPEWSRASSIAQQLTERDNTTP